MLSTKLKEAAGNSADATLYVDDVFSTWLYTGNGSTQTITNGIDLAGKGGLVWIKSRTNPSGYFNHQLVDTNRGANNCIQSNLTNGQSALGCVTGFGNSGFNIDAGFSPSGYNYASWTFRKAAKFFDVVTYTGTGSARTIAHSLGVAPGMIIVKRTDTTGNWQVYSNGLTSAANSIQLNLTAAQASAPTVWNSTAPTSSVFSVGTDATVNASGGTYVAYLYAHDTSSTGIIQCGSTVADASGNFVISLGYEPQFVLIKRTDVSDWAIYDVMRDATSAKVLKPNTSTAEGVYTGTTQFQATGVTISSGGGAGTTAIYMAIRRPNKPPTTGAQVYNAIARTGTGAAATVTGVGFAPDLVQISQRPLGSGKNWIWFDRLRGGAQMVSSDNTGAESTNSVVIQSDSLSTTMDGFRIQTANPVNSASYTYINYSLKRAPGFFDEVCYTGTGANMTIPHNLTVAPELVIVKKRNAAQYWVAGVPSLSPDYAVNFSNSTPFFNAGALFFGNDSIRINPTSSLLYFGSAASCNGAADTFVAYLFATLAGISKVGSYTGNGGTQNIECGFAAGARFVLIKRTDSTGDWFVWDTARGIVSANDPHLSLNTTAAEVTTDDSVDPYSAGFAVNQVTATNINVSSATYIFLAIA